LSDLCAGGAARSAWRRWGGGAVSNDEEEIKRAILDSYRSICLCNKIRKGVIDKAIREGARTFQDVKRRTRAGTGPCGAKRCGPVIAEMLKKKKKEEQPR